MKSRLVSCICFLSYWLGIDELFYFLNRKAKRIITFHNILPDQLFRPGVANGVSHSLSSFESIINQCAKRYEFSTNLLDSKTLTVTFDDGYRNQYTTAFKYLHEHGIPAYLFVSGDILPPSRKCPLGDSALLIDKLLHWVSEVPIEYIPGGNRLKYWVDGLWPRFIADVKCKGQNLFDELNKCYPYEKIVENLSSSYVRERLAGIESFELAEMRKSGWRVGWHAKSHYPLSLLPEDVIREELDAEVAYKSVALSYPYGDTCLVDERVLNIARELGYPCAVSNQPLQNCLTGLYFMLRMTLSSNKYRLHFQLSGLEHFLKTRKLLPLMDSI